MTQEDGFMQAQDQTADDRIRPPAATQLYPLSFTGTGGEYFRIWIVNLFLTVITLGIYAAWAKVRTRQYFYANTYLAGQQFEYLGNPVAILKGNIIVAGGFILYSIMARLYPEYGFLVMIPLGLFLPVLIHQALRFYLHNSAYRDIRFRFLGTLPDSYRTYLFIPVLIPLTLGLILPYWMFKKKQYFLDNSAFGTTRTVFKGSSGPFYRTYMKAGLMGIGSLLIAILLIVFVGTFAIKVIDPSRGMPPNPASNGFFIIVPLVTTVVLVFIMTLVMQYVYARLTNYSLDYTDLGNIRFRSTIKALDLSWLQLTNMAAIILSIGLLIPWAKVRRTRYILANISVLVTGTLDEFTAAMDMDESALGDSATGFFDMEIGL